MMMMMIIRRVAESILTVRNKKNLHATFLSGDRGKTELCIRSRENCKHGAIDHQIVDADAAVDDDGRRTS